jgi:hypothetical protein
MSDAAPAPSASGRLLRITGLVVLWAWGLLNTIGGIGLLIKQGPWPLTNGWFALCGGLCALPATAWIVRRLTGFQIPMGLQFAAAAGFYLAGRVALEVTGRGHFLPTLTN